MRLIACILTLVACTHAENQSVANTKAVQALYQTSSPHQHQVEVQRTTLHPQQLIQPLHQVHQVQEQAPQVESQLPPQPVQPLPPQVNYYQPQLLAQIYQQPIESPHVRLQAIPFYIQPQFQQQSPPEPTDEPVQIPFQPHLKVQPLEREQQQVEPEQVHLQHHTEPQIQRFEQQQQEQRQTLQLEPQEPELQPNFTPKFPREYPQLRHIKLHHERYQGSGGLIVKTPQEEYLDTFAPPPQFEYLSLPGHSQQAPLPLVQTPPSLQKLFLGPNYNPPTLYQPQVRYHLPIPDYGGNRILQDPEHVGFQEQHLLRNEVEQPQQVIPRKVETEFLRPSPFPYANQQENHETKTYLPQHQYTPLQFRPVFYFPKQASFGRQASLPGGLFPQHFIYQLSHVPRLFFPQLDLNTKH